MRKEVSMVEGSARFLFWILWWESIKPKITSLTTNTDVEILQKKAIAPWGRGKIFDCQKRKKWPLRNWIFRGHHGMTKLLVEFMNYLSFWHSKTIFGNVQHLNEQQQRNSSLQWLLRYWVSLRTFHLLRLLGLTHWLDVHQTCFFSSWMQISPPTFPSFPFSTMWTNDWVLAHGIW